MCPSMYAPLELTARSTSVLQVSCSFAGRSVYELFLPLHAPGAEAELNSIRGGGFSRFIKSGKIEFHDTLSGAGYFQYLKARRKSQSLQEMKRMSNFQCPLCGVCAAERTPFSRPSFRVPPTFARHRQPLSYRVRFLKRVAYLSN